MAKKMTAAPKNTSSKAKAAGKVPSKKKPAATSKAVPSRSTTKGVKAKAAVKGTPAKATPAARKGAQKAAKKVSKPTKPVPTAKTSAPKRTKASTATRTAPKKVSKPVRSTKGNAKSAPEPLAPKGSKVSGKASSMTVPASRISVKVPVKRTAEPLAKKSAPPPAAAATKASRNIATKAAGKGTHGAGPSSPEGTKVAPAAIAVKPTAKRPEAPKRPAKERVQLEFMVRSAPAVLFDLISTPSGFSEWYCSDVNMKGDQYTFIWPDEEESTTMIGRRIGEVIRFRRNDEEDENAYFEFRIRIDAMTNEVALIVTDHAWPDEVEGTRNLWSSQIAELIRVLGA